jgi:hypothetical protein
LSRLESEEVRFDLVGRILSRGGDPTAMLEVESRRRRARGSKSHRGGGQGAGQEGGGGGGDNNALFHHGQDQHLPGYTFGEMRMLMLSAFPQQRGMGLKVCVRVRVCVCLRARVSGWVFV